MLDKCGLYVVGKLNILIVTIVIYFFIYLNLSYTLKVTVQEAPFVLLDYTTDPPPRLTLQL
jgi:hypothetical protein